MITNIEIKPSKVNGKNTTLSCLAFKLDEVNYFSHLTTDKKELNIARYHLITIAKQPLTNIRRIMYNKFKYVFLNL